MRGRKDLIIISGVWEKKCTQHSNRNDAIFGCESERERERWHEMCSKRGAKVSYLMGSLAAIFHNKIGT